MDKTGWITHCFGRFLIDLPPDAKINSGYYLWGNSIEKTEEKSEELEARINKIEQEYRQRINLKNNKIMFIRRLDLGSGSKAVLSWATEASLEAYSLDAYVLANPQKTIYRLKGDVSVSREKIAIDSSMSLAKNIRSRASNEIPTEPGFCMDGAYIAGDAFQSEALDIGITFPNHPGAFFSFSSSTGAEQDRLLDRVGGFLSGAAKLVAGIETLRKGERDGAIVGEEYLVAGSGKGQRVYAFIWEFQGKDNSVTQPYIRAGLEVGEAQKDAEGNLPAPPFKSDQAALQLWDTIIDSIRLRPTSPPRDDKASTPPEYPPAYNPDDYVLEEFLAELRNNDKDWMDKL